MAFLSLKRTLRLLILSAEELPQEKFSVCVVSDGLEARWLATDQPLDVVLLDL
jgi:DNA-binding response OmpR family regulator